MLLLMRRSFDTLVGEWQTVELPFAKFAPIFRAKTVQNAAPLNPSSVASIQVGKLSDLLSLYNSALVSHA